MAPHKGGRLIVVTFVPVLDKGGSQGKMARPIHKFATITLQPMGPLSNRERVPHSTNRLAPFVLASTPISSQLPDWIVDLRTHIFAIMYISSLATRRISRRKRDYCRRNPALGRATAAR